MDILIRKILNYFFPLSLLSALNTPCSYEPVFKLKYIRKNETDIKRKIRCRTQVCEFSGKISTYFGLPAHFRAGKYI